MCGTNTLGLANRFQLGCAGDCGCEPKGLAGYGKQINWDTTPVINTYVYDRDGYWNCNDWMTWHQKLAAKWGIARANEVFLTWWNKQSWYNYAVDQCMLLNQTFRKYFNDTAKLNLDALYTALSTPTDIVTDVLSTTKNVADKATDVVDDVAETATNTSSILKYAVPAVLVLALVGIGFYVHKNYIKGNERVKVGPATV